MINFQKCKHHGLVKHRAANVCLECEEQENANAIINNISECVHGEALKDSCMLCAHKYGHNARLIRCPLPDAPEMKE